MADPVSVATSLVAGEVLNAVLALGWRGDGIRKCAGCGHEIAHFRRTLGILWGRHDQITCGCRLARHNREDKQQSTQGMCGCEWTQDC